MAKKPKPEWGKSYPGLSGNELVSQEQALQLAKLANVPASQMNSFLEELFQIIHALRPMITCNGKKHR
jgi:hypothetical protein